MRIKNWKVVGKQKIFFINRFYIIYYLNLNNCIAEYITSITLQYNAISFSFTINFSFNAILFFSHLRVCVENYTFDVAASPYIKLGAPSIEFGNINSIRSSFVSLSMKQC